MARIEQIYTDFSVQHIKVNTNFTNCFVQISEIRVCSFYFIWYTEWVKQVKEQLCYPFICFNQ
jgi:hypothetical protein